MDEQAYFAKMTEAMKLMLRIQMYQAQELAVIRRRLVGFADEFDVERDDLVLALAVALKDEK